MGKRPNIILITTDQQRTDTLSCYGNPVADTPHIDKLAREGMQFNRAYVNSPVCTPSRACIMTGRYPRSHGVSCNGIPLSDTESTLAELLRESGYQTASLGKVHLGPTQSNDTAKYIESKNLDANGEEFFRNWSGPYYGFEYTQLSIGHATASGNGGHYGVWLKDNYPEEQRHYTDPAGNAPESPSGAPFGSLKWGLRKEAHSTTWTADRTCEYLRERKSSNAEKPFFAWVSFEDPHFPFACPEPYCNKFAPKDVPLPIPAVKDWSKLPPHFEHWYRGEFNRLHKGRFPYAGPNNDMSEISEEHAREMITNYYGMVNLIDEGVGRILDTLDQLKMKEETLVIFTSDHGELLGDHGLWLKGPFHYEGLIRVPLIFRYPKKIKPGVVTDAMFSLVDLVPTCLDLTGIGGRPEIQGISQISVLENRDTAVRTRALCELRLPFDGDPINAKTLVTERYKLTCYAGRDYGELYDLQADPTEEWNLWSVSDYQDLKRKLVYELLMTLMETEDPMPFQVSLV